MSHLPVVNFSRTAALDAAAAARSAGKKIIYTSGTFDLLHSGHTSYLEFAKALGGFLIVGVNSDASVAQYKEPRRPIQPQDVRCAIVTALRAVDCVFVFPETNNNENVRLLRPDIYVKAGDYTASKLSSAGLVEEYGGKVMIAPFQDGFSSSQVIETIVSRYGDRCESLSSQPKLPLTPAVFVDRDGTINEFVEFLSEPEKFQFIPQALEGLKLLKQAGFRLVVTTNQPGIGLGYFTREDMFRVNRVMLKAADKEGFQFDKVYFCPDSYAVESEFRKPAPGMIQRGTRELNLDIANSYVVGDMTIDLEFARRAGCRSVLVQTGVGGKDAKYDGHADLNATNLFEAANKIIEDYEYRKRNR